MPKKKIAFLLSHPIQYFSPLLAELDKTENVELMVYYCSDHGVAQKIDKEFGKIVQWDIPLLEGYPYEFLPNLSPNPSVVQFGGLFNPAIIQKLISHKPDLLLVHGWGYWTHCLAIFAAKFLGIKIWLRGETPYQQAFLQPSKKKWFKKLLFRGIDKFLYIGAENKQFYQHFGITSKQLVFTPYAIDNQRFSQSYNDLKDQKQNLRKQFGLAAAQVVFLFCGKLIHKKQPLLLLEAYKNIANPNKALLLVGDGELQTAVNEYIATHQLQNVHWVGFKNQSELATYYTLADVFVLPSTVGETWGLVTNEAMNFELPLLVSSMVGCAKDLVQEGQNGYTFQNENAADLAAKMQLLIENPDFLKTAGKISKQLISQYTIAVCVGNLRKEIIGL